jgi:hypothetical protein
MVVQFFNLDLVYILSYIITFTHINIGVGGDGLPSHLSSAEVTSSLVWHSLHNLHHLWFAKYAVFLFSRSCYFQFAFFWNSKSVFCGHMNL